MGINAMRRVYTEDPCGMTLETRRLAYVDALARAGTFSRAGAEELGVTQPTLSRAIQGLGGRVGGRLFDRLLRGSPDRSGQRSHCRARPILSATLDLERELAAIQGLETGHLKELVGPYVAVAEVWLFNDRERLAGCSALSGHHDALAASGSAVRCQSLTALADLVESSDAIGIFSRGMLRRRLHDGTLAVPPLDGPRPTSNRGILDRKDRTLSPAASAFFEATRWADAEVPLD